MRTAVHTSLPGAGCSTSYRSGAWPTSKLHAALLVRCAGYAQEAAAAQPSERRPLVVKSIPAARTAAPPPQPVAVEHSSAYLLRNRRQLSDSEEEAAAQSATPESFNGSAVEWMLRKADESLDDIEENPPEYVKKLYEVSNGPIGKAASQGVTTAAKATVVVGTEALKAAAPVGKWALQQGLKLAVGAVTSAITSDKKTSGKSKK